MTATVSEVRFDEGFVKASFADLELIIDERIGFINASQLCSSKGEELTCYDGTQLRGNLELAFTTYKSMVSYEVLPTLLDNQCLAGRYFHPALLLNLAARLSPEIYVHSAALIDSYFQRTEQRRRQLCALFACKEIVTYEYDIDPPVCWIRYGRCHLEVDGRAWFSILHSNSGTGKVVMDFEATGQDVASLLEYFRRENLVSATHYHPLLFLRLANSVNADFYAKCAHLVFCCNEVRLNWLLRSEIAAAGGSSVKYPVPSDGGSLFVRSPLFWREFLKQTISGVGIFWDMPDSDDSSATTDSMSSTMDLDSDEEVLAGLKLELERERRQKESALAQAREKEACLARVQEEKRAAEQRERLKDEQLEALMRRLEDIEMEEDLKKLQKRRRARK